MGDEVTSIVLNFLKKCILDNCINFTYVVLIPKVNNHVCASDFRPISFCNVIYKLLSKVLANRLIQILPSIISKTQSAFILSHLIFDNIIVTYEALHSMKSRQRGRVGSMAVKLDIFKTYVKLEWNFLEVIMHRLGFNENWISKIMTCVKTVSYLVFVNGQPSFKFIPTKGLHQRDPISPTSILFV